VARQASVFPAESGGVAQLGKAGKPVAPPLKPNPPGGGGGGFFF